MDRRLYKIKLYGLLGKTYGTEFIEIYGRNVRDVFSGLSSRFGDSFKDTIVSGAWHITSGKRETDILSEQDNFLSEEILDLPLPTTELHIFPAITGAGGRGIGQIILGVVLIVAAVAIAIINPVAGGGIMASIAASGTASSLAMAGALSIAGGLLAMISKVPTMDNYANAATQDQRPSFLFNGTVNNTEQGVPVPLVYGEHLTGSTVISAGIHVERI